MEHKKPHNNYKVVKFLSEMPRKILSLHGRDNVTDFVLHDLASKSCFNLAKASYFVDNPDFDHLKGVSGYSETQSFEHPNRIWEHPDVFTNHMQGSPFNKQVRSFIRTSPKKESSNAQDIVTVIAQELSLDNPNYITWDMKHDNHGFFVYENSNGQDEWTKEDLINALYLVSLCPKF